MKTIIGNLLDQTPGVLCHQVNTLGVMGAGLALQIRLRWPSVYAQYRLACSAGNLKLGDVQFEEVAPSVHVANLAGQDDIGAGECMTSYKHYPAMLQAVSEFAEAMSLPIYIPQFIGCGLAGGDWKVMLAIIEKHCPEATLVQWSGK